WTFRKYVKQKGCCRLCQDYACILPAEKGHDSSFKIVRACAGCSMSHTPRDLLHDEKQKYIEGTTKHTKISRLRPTSDLISSLSLSRLMPFNNFRDEMTHATRKKKTATGLLYIYL
ncbi:unnamed protein product, partial [Ectocarpus sp. 13 AM-2016]